MRHIWTQDITPDRAKLGDVIARTTVEEVCRLLGHNPADVLGVLMTPTRIDVMATGQPDRSSTVLHRHVVQ